MSTCRMSLRCSSNSTRRSKLLLVLAGVGALAVVLVTLTFSWKEIPIRHHLSKLRSDPAYISEVIEQQEDAVVREALRRAIATPDGGETFRRAIVLEVLGASERRPEEIGPEETVSVLPYSQEGHVNVPTLSRDIRFDLDANEASRIAAFYTLFRELRNPSRVRIGERRFHVAVTGSRGGFCVRAENDLDDSPEEP